MPIFKSFIKKAIKRGDARPFKVAKNIKFLVVDQKTGRKADFGSKTTIIEAFKKSDLTKKNKARTWLYGYNEKYNVIVISKTGQIGEIISISG